MVDRDLTNLEAVALAVRSEIESTDLYEQLTKTVKNPEVKKMLEDLAADEEQHRQSLMKLYESMLEGEEPSIPMEEGREKKMDLGPDPDYLQLMKAAVAKEIDSEAFYKKAAKKVRDHKTRMFFIELAEVERKHASVLQKQVDKLEEDPHWFDRDDSEPKLVHEGP